MDDLAAEDVSARVRERVATIDVETGHLVQMVNELLDLSRIEQAGSEVRQDVVELAPLIASTSQRLRTFADRQGVVLEQRVADDLPRARGDEERLEQLLTNLLHQGLQVGGRGLPANGD